MTHLDPAALEFGPVIFNAVFVTDEARHRAEIRSVWSGPACVLARPVPSARELARIRAEAEHLVEGIGLRMLWSQGPSVQPVVEIGVIADIDGRAQAALDACYGSGVLRVVPALRPLR